VLAIYALATQRPFIFELSAAYIGSLVYLALFGSVVAFLFYYGLARAVAVIRRPLTSPH